MEERWRRSVDTERAVAVVWRQVLGTADFGPDDNFFDLGGNSLLLLKVHAQLMQALGTDIAVTELFQFPTTRSLAARLAPQSFVESREPPKLDDVEQRARRQRMLMVHRRRIEPA